MSYSFDPGSTTVMYAQTFGSTVTPSAGDQLSVFKAAFGADGAITPVTTTDGLPTKAVATDPGVVALQIIDDWDSTDSCKVVKTGDVISVTPTMDTNIYANGDLLFDVTTITSATRVTGGTAKLISLTVIDEDDQKNPMSIYITNVNTTWGTFNAAPSVSDTAARSIQAIIPIVAADYKDLGGVSVAQPRLAQGILAMLKSSGSANLYCTAVADAAGTPTYTASGLKIVFGFEQN